MGAVDPELLSTAPEDMDLDTLLADLGLEGVPYRTEVSLIKQRQSLTMTVPSEARKEAGCSLDEPGTADVLWWGDEDVLLVHLGGDDGE
jgi:hypothetical protein